MAKAPFRSIRLAPDEPLSWLLNPGVLRDVVNLVPTVNKTYKTCFSDLINPNDSAGWVSQIALASLGVPVYGEVIPRIGNNSPRCLVGTKAKKIAEIASGTGWFDVSPAAFTAGGDGGYDYSFDSWGDNVYFVSATGLPGTNGSVPYVSIAGGAFAALGGSPPKAAILVVQQNFVVLFDTNTYGPDSWVCSPFGAPSSSWAQNFATQANYGYIRATVGPITAAIKFGGQIIVFKENSMYRMTYVGGDATWATSLISDQVGCPSRHGVVNVDGVLYFVSQNGFYRFDGSYPVAISPQVRTFYQAHLQNYAVQSANCQAFADRKEGLIHWMIPYGQDKDVDVVFSYQTGTGEWGKLLHPWPEAYDRSPASINNAGILCWLGNPSNGYERLFGDNSISMVSIGTYAGNFSLKKHIYGKPSYWFSGVSSIIPFQCQNYTNVWTGDIGDQENHSRIYRVRPEIVKVDYGDGDFANYFSSFNASLGIKHTVADRYNKAGLKLTLQPSNTTNEFTLKIKKPRGNFEGADNFVVTANSGFRFFYHVLAGVAGPWTMQLGLRVVFTDASVFDATTTVTDTSPPFGAFGPHAMLQGFASLASQAGKTIANLESISILVKNYTGPYTEIWLRRIHLEVSNTPVWHYYNYGHPAFLGITRVNQAKFFYEVVHGDGVPYNFDTEEKVFDDSTDNTASPIAVAGLRMFGGYEIGGLSGFGGPGGTSRN